MCNNDDEKLLVINIHVEFVGSFCDSVQHIEYSIKINNINIASLLHIVFQKLFTQLIKIKTVISVRRIRVAIHTKFTTKNWAVNPWLVAIKHHHVGNRPWPNS